jgi:PIN domain nuclease of toxin-antitoxin system
MKLLLDTCTFLWIALDDASLSATARGLFLDEDHEVYLSPVSAWEIVVKHGLGRLALPGEPARWIVRQREGHGIAALPLDEDSVLALLRIPSLHRDPFDRMLVCQALTHGMTILTPDELIRQYPAPVAW